MEQGKLLATYNLTQIPKPNIKPPGAEYKLCLLRGGQKGLDDGVRVTKPTVLFFVCILLFTQLQLPVSHKSCNRCHSLASIRSSHHPLSINVQSDAIACRPVTGQSRSMDHAVWLRACVLAVQLWSGVSYILQEFFRKTWDFMSVERGC